MPEPCKKRMCCLLWNQLMHIINNKFYFVIHCDSKQKDDIVIVKNTENFRRGKSEKGFIVHVKAVTSIVIVIVGGTKYYSVIVLLQYFEGFLILSNYCVCKILARGMRSWLRTSTFCYGWGIDM